MSRNNPCHTTASKKTVDKTPKTLKTLRHLPDSIGSSQAKTTATNAGARKLPMLDKTGANKKYKLNQPGVHARDIK